MTTQKQNTENNRIQNEINITPNMVDISLFEALANDRKNNELYLQYLRSCKCFKVEEIHTLLKILNCEKKKGCSPTVVDIIRKSAVYQKYYPELSYETVHKLSFLDDFLIYYNKSPFI